VETWTEERVERLESLWTAGQSAALVDRALGVTRSAVLGKVSRLKLSERATLATETETIWIPERVERLKELWAGGMRTKPIAQALGVDHSARPASRRAEPRAHPERTGCAHPERTPCARFGCGQLRLQRLDVGDG
jgi:hypothetical protein